MLEFLNELSARDLVYLAYQLALGRDPSDEDLLNSIASLRHGLDRELFFKQVFSSEEHISFIYNKSLNFIMEDKLRSNVQLGELLCIPDNLFVHACYRLLLGRDVDGDGLVFYLSKLNKGYRRTRIIYDIVRSGEFIMSPELKPLVDMTKSFEARLDGMITSFLYRRLGVDKLFDFMRCSLPGLSLLDGMVKNNVTVKPQSFDSTLPIVSHIKESMVSRLDSDRRILRGFENNTHPLISRFLVLSVSPYDKTGVSNFNVKLFSSSFCEVDYFCHFNSDIDYDAALFSENENLFFYDIGSVFTAIKTKKYSGIIVVLANSDHNVLPAIFLDRILALGIKNISLYIHDVVLFNVAKKLYDYKSKEFLVDVEGQLPPSVFNKYKSSLEAGDYGILVENDMSGLDMILDNRAVDHVFVNSSHAKSLIEKTDPYLSGKISTLFHPVFDAFRVRNKLDCEDLVIGTFGVPGDDKLTEFIFNAFLAISATNSNAKLIIAGYGVYKFFSSIAIPKAVSKAIVLAEPESSDDLLDLMSQVTVAIQLRKLSNGESSGIVPQLLALDVPCIVSRIGSFTDFDGVVHFMEREASMEDLIKMIMSVHRFDSVGTEKRKNFVRMHTSEKCLSLLLNEIVGHSVHDIQPTDSFDFLKNTCL